MKNSKGFTIIELIVVIGIVSILAAITISAILSIRTQARRTTCSSRVMQIGQSMLNYESANQKFPTSIWQMDLLPFMGLDAVKTGFDEILFSVWGTNFLIAVTMTWKYEEIPTLPKFQMYQSKIQFIEECVKGRIVKDY